MGQNVGNLGIHDFANMLHMDGFGKFAHKAENTKGVLYLDASNKLCNANRHSKNVTIRDTSPEQLRRNLELRESLVSALQDAGLRNREAINKIRDQLGLPPEKVKVSGEGADLKLSEDLEMCKPLRRRDVKLIIDGALEKLSDKTKNVMGMTTDELKAMVKKETQGAARTRQFLKICNWDLNKKENDVQNSILKKDLGSALQKYVGFCAKSDAEISKLGQSKGRDVLIKTAVVRNKADFIGSLTFKEAQALSLFCRFGSKALMSYSPTLAPNLERLDWEHIGDLFTLDGDGLNHFSFKEGAVELDVDDLLSASYHLAKDLGKIRKDVDKHLESLPKDEAPKLPEEPVEVAGSEEKPADAEGLWRSDANAFCERYLQSLCDQGGLLNTDSKVAFMDYLEGRADIPKEEVDSYVDAWKILTRSESVNGRNQSGALTNPRVRERLLKAAEAMKTSGEMSTDAVKAGLMQAVLDEIASIAELVEGRLVVDKLEGVEPKKLFETQSFNYNMDPVVSTYNALMMTGRADAIRKMTVRVPGTKPGKTVVSQWNFPCRDKDGKPIVVTAPRVGEMKVRASATQSADAWYSKWGASGFEKAAFCALQDLGSVDRELSFGVPVGVAHAFQLFGLGEPEVFGRDGVKTPLADALHFAHEAQRALSEGRPCVLRQDGHCYPVVAVDLRDPFNPKIRVAESHLTSNSDVDFHMQTFAFDPLVYGGKSLRSGFEIFVSKEVPKSDESTIHTSQTEAQDDVIDTTLKRDDVIDTTKTDRSTEAQDDVIDTTRNGLGRFDPHDINIVEDSDDEEESDTVPQENAGTTVQNEAVESELPKVAEPSTEPVRETPVTEINEPQKQVLETAQEKVEPRSVEEQPSVPNQPTENQPSAANRPVENQSSAANRPVEKQPAENQPVAVNQPVENQSAAVNRPVEKQPAENQPAAVNRPVEKQPAAEQSQFGKRLVEGAKSPDQKRQFERISAFHNKLTPAQRAEVERIFASRKHNNQAYVRAEKAYPKSDAQLWQESYCAFVLTGWCAQGGILNPANEQEFRQFLGERLGAQAKDPDKLVEAWKILTKQELRGQQILRSTYNDLILWNGLQSVTDTIVTPKEGSTGQATPEAIVKAMEAAVLGEISKIADAMKESQPVIATNFPKAVPFTTHYKAQAVAGNTCPIISTVNAMLSSNNSKAITEMMTPKNTEQGTYYEFPYDHNGQPVRVMISEIEKMEIRQVNPRTHTRMGPFSDFEKAVFLALQKTGLLGYGPDMTHIQLGDVFEVSGVFQLFGMAEPSFSGKPSGSMMNSEALQYAHEALKALKEGKPCVLRQNGHFLAITGVDLRNPEDPKITVVESVGALPSQKVLSYSNGALQRLFQIYIGQG